ncbi:MAG: DMT family transporter [Desulfocapsaceae bacterium]|jgi:drug/metabolite transporter (DMT)-like permease
MPLQVSPYLLLCLTSLFWSLNLIIGKVLAGAVPPATLSFLRWLPAFFFFLLFYGKNLRDGYRVLREYPMLVLLLGATGYSINSITVYEAVTYSTTINISFINAFNPVLIAITGYIMYRYPVSGRQALGFFISLLGVITIIFRGEFARLLALQTNIGDLFMLFSISIWSVHTVIYKNKSQRFNRRTIFLLMIMAGLAVTLPFAVLESYLSDWEWARQIQPHHILAILALTIFPSVLAILFWNYALTKISANQVAIFQYLIPVYTTIISIIFLKERLQLFHICGGALILAGVLLVTTFSADRKTKIT